MIILHSALLDTGLFLWAEAPVDADPVPPEAGLRRAGEIPGYPYAADFDVLSRTIRNLPVGFSPTRRRLETATAWLPTRSRMPFPSNALVGPEPDGRGGLRLASWQVEGLLLGPEEYYRVLTVFGERARALSGLMVGRDFSFWIQGLRLAGSLVARQRYLPDIEQQGARWHARWCPVWLGDDALSRERLARAMPTAARALTLGDAAHPPRVPARQRLESFVAAVVDQIVRRQGGLPAETSPRGTKAAKRPQAADGRAIDRWLRALRSPDSLLVAVPEEIAELARQIRHWREPIDQAARAPFRLCFRLEEPTAGGSEGPEAGRRKSAGRGRQRQVEPPPAGQRRWYVRFFLQGTQDPSLLVPATDAWITRGRKAAALSRMGEDLHELLLAFLGQAARLCPRIAETLRSNKPTGFALDTRGAHEFLTVTAPALRQAGFGTLLPDWWTGASTSQRLSVRARVDTPPLAEIVSPSLDEAQGFEWEVCVGGHVLGDAELDAMAKLKEPLQRVQGHWVETGVDEVRAALEFRLKRQAPSVSGRELVRLALGSADTSTGIRFDGVAATGWMEVLRTRLLDKELIGHIEAPGGFVGTLRGYQERGYTWLDFLSAWGFGACLADDMGLGKTIQTLALLQREQERGVDRPVLIICPTSVLANWEHEARRFTPELACYVHHGPGRPRAWDFVVHAQQHAVVLTSYALLQRDADDLSMLQWAGLILDEAQNIKNPDTKQARAVRTLAADYRIALTGTPVENHVGDLWAIMDFLNPGFLGSAEEFKQHFFVPIQRFGDREASERLHQMTAPFVLRRLKTDRSIISDLPEKLETKVYCALTGEQARLYEEIVTRTEAQLRRARGLRRRGVILAALTKLKQVCNHPAQYLQDGSELVGRSSKLTRLTEMLDEILTAGERSVLFTQFVVMGKLLQEHLQEHLGREVLLLHGGTPKRKRDTMVARFQSGEAAPPVFVLSLKAGGTGLNLTAANHVFHFDRWWNPAVENQATDRVFRIGQTRRVLVHKFVCAGTLEEHIDAMIERKRSIAEDIVGTGENWITEMSDDELHEILTLDPGVVRD